jgi:hypothetical protein
MDRSTLHRNDLLNHGQHKPPRPTARRISSSSTPGIVTQSGMVKEGSKPEDPDTRGEHERIALWGRTQRPSKFVEFPYSNWKLYIFHKYLMTVRSSVSLPTLEAPSISYINYPLFVTSSMRFHGHCAPPHRAIRSCTPLVCVSVSTLGWPDFDAGFRGSQYHQTAKWPLHTFWVFSTRDPGADVREAVPVGYGLLGARQGFFL